MTAAPIRIIVVDDSPLYRRTICDIIEKQPNLQIVAEAGDGAYAIQAIKEHRPDVVLMDITLPVMDGLEATRIITSKFPDTRVIILSMHSGDTMNSSSCQAGACSYLCKDCSINEILGAIESDHHKS